VELSMDDRTWLRLARGSGLEKGGSAPASGIRIAAWAGEPVYTGARGRRPGEHSLKLMSEGGRATVSSRFAFRGGNLNLPSLRSVGKWAEATCNALSSFFGKHFSEFFQDPCPTPNANARGTNPPENLQRPRSTTGDAPWHHDGPRFGD
jgi:hypothetical protein